MAKASKKRAGKKRKAKKAAGKKVRARKAASKRAAPKAKRKATKARRAKSKSKRKPMPKAPAMMPTSKGESWPMIFAVVVALLAGIAVMWHFGGISIAAAATVPLPTAIAPAMGFVYAGCDVIASADTWLALAHADLAPSLR